MVWKWIKDNIIGDYAEEVRKRETKDGEKAEAWKELKTRVFSTRDFAVEIVGESNYQDALIPIMDDYTVFSLTRVDGFPLSRE